MVTGDQETIAAVATPPGRGGIGIVRISGPDISALCLGVLGRMPAPRVATHAAFMGADRQAIDQGVAVFFRAPHSFTGQDVLELQAHGGPVVLQMLLRRCVELGARIAEPGEFTQRAFLNGKLDLAQAEGIADLIEASTESAARCAVRSLRGEFSALIDAMVAQLIELRMLSEAAIDFPEEEIDTGSREDAARRLHDLRRNVAQVLAQGKQGSILRTGLQIVLAGQPNVGKSSMLNRLAGEDLAIVTAVPGTTRDTLRQAIQIDGVPLNIIDTAGLRETSEEVESLGIARTWQAIERADLLLLVVDGSVGISVKDEEIIRQLPARLPHVVVFNKIDLTGTDAKVEQEGRETRIWLSAKTGKGFELLRQSLLSIVGWRGTGEDIFMARQRHLVALERASDCLVRAEGMMDRPELVAEELRLAQNELNRITGEFLADDLLGEIFSRFCIGK